MLSSFFWTNQPSTEELEEQLQHLPSALDFMGLNARCAVQAVGSKVNTNDEELDPSQESSQQVAGGPASALASTQDSIEVSIEASWERGTCVSSAWEVVNEESSSQSIDRHTSTQHPLNTPNDVTVCSGSRDTSSWPSFFSSNGRLSESDMNSITELFHSGCISEYSLWHLLHYLYDLQPEIVKILIQVSKITCHIE